MSLETVTIIPEAKVLVLGLLVSSFVTLGLFLNLTSFGVKVGPRASSAKTRGFHTQLDEGPETP